MNTSLEFGDFFWIWVIVSLFAGGNAAYRFFKPSDAARIGRIETKIDLILNHLKLEYQDPRTSGVLSEEVKALADAGNKIQAIKLYREATGFGLKEAKDAVEAYLNGR